MARALALAVLAMAADPLGPRVPVRCQAAEVLTLGSDAGTFYLVDHGDSVSVYANAVPVDSMLERLREVGGPSYRTRVELTRPVTLSLHRVPWRVMFDRMFAGLNVAYYVRGARVARIRVLGRVPGRSYKMAPRTSESLETWMARETGEDAVDEHSEAREP